MYLCNSYRVDRLLDGAWLLSLLEPRVPLATVDVGKKNPSYYKGKGVRGNSNTS